MPVELGVRRWVNVWSLSAFLPVLAVVLLGLYGSWTVAGVLAFGFAAALVWTTRRAVRLTGSRPPELVGPPLAAAAALVAFGAYALVHG